MNLRTYTESLPRGGIAALAERLGIGGVYLSQLSGRQQGRVPSPALCVAIEFATSGAVTRKDLRPGDWCRIWPELQSPLGHIDNTVAAGLAASQDCPCAEAPATIPPPLRL